MAPIAAPIASIWTAYGLSDDPFFQMPLEPRTDTAAKRPTTLHVGRERELQTIVSRIVSDGTSRSLVHGDAGVGKTSFISKLKTTLADQRVLMHAEPVRVVAYMTPRHFMAEILKVLLQMRATQTASDGWLSRQVGAARAETAFWTRLRRLIIGEDAAAIGASVGVLGGQYEPVRLAGDVAELSLFDEVRQALEYLARRGACRVLLHVNNLEALAGARMESAARLLQQVRDVFLAPHGHWLFVGTSDIEAGIFRAHSQVSSIIPPSTHLGPLAPAEVAELLRRRYAHLQRGRRLVEPLAADDAGALYARYRGDLRRFLTLASEGVRRHALVNPGVPVTSRALVESLAEHYWTQSLSQRVDVRDAQHLRTALAGEPFDVEFHAALLKRRIGTISQPTASALIRRLEKAGVIAHVRTQGRSVFYRVADGDAAVALGLR